MLRDSQRCHSRRRPRPFGFAVVLLTLAGLAVAACTSNGSESTEASDTSTAAIETEATVEEPSSESDAELNGELDTYPNAESGADAESNDPVVEPDSYDGVTRQGQGPDGLAFAEPTTTTTTVPAATVSTTVAPTTATTAVTTTAPSSSTSSTTTAAADTTPVTAGSGLGAVTTTGGGGGGDTAIYQGVLGRIGPNQLITPAVAPAPTAAPGILPLTGLPGAVPNRPAAVVKIDNGGSARPQSGLNAADIVIEEEVEGGITRFAAIFHSTPSIVGPIRSARTTDIGILNGLGSPLLLYSGANEVTDAIVRSQATVQNRNAGTSSGYWRNSSRRAPSNLYSDTAPHWASATGGPPPPQFAYRAAGVGAAGANVSSFNVSYRSSKAAWQWDGAAWLRTQGGRAHMTATGERVSAANVVVIEAREVPTGMVDSSGSNVPEFVFVGTDKATVFTDGKRIEGIWTRPTLRSVATLTTSSGAVIELTPGRTWIELIRADSGILG